MLDKGTFRRKVAWLIIMINGAKIVYKEEQGQFISAEIPDFRKINFEKVFESQFLPSLKRWASLRQLGDLILPMK
jgi:hypothetical protein